MTQNTGFNPLQYEGVRSTNPPNVIPALRNPLTSDVNYEIGTEWINQSTQAVFFLSSVSAGLALWTIAGSGTTGAINSITGDSGGAEVPLAGNFSLLGTANQITVTGAAHKETFSVPSAFIAPGSIAATTTVTAGTGITATTGNIVASTGNITSTLGSVGAATTVTAGTDITATLGNVIINGAAKQLRVHGGAVTDFIGEATLGTGTVTVLNTNIAATDKIFISRRSINGSTAIGAFTYAITPTTSFTITSVQMAAPAMTETNDVSIVEYFIVRQV